MPSSRRELRICSLLPSATEIVAALGCSEQLVGVSEECDWPPQVQDLPVVTSSRIDTRELSGQQIDVEVRNAIADGRSLYGIDRELLERLRPDLVLTQDLCEVCAVSSGEFAEVSASEAETMSLDAYSLADIEECVTRLATRLGIGDRGEDVVARMRKRIDDVRTALADVRPRRVFVAEWLDPPFAAGHWVPEMVRLAGGIDVLGKAGQPSYATTWDEVLAQQPEVVILAPCGFDAQRAVRESGVVHAPGCRVIAVDANAYYSRPAPRVADGIAQLGSLLHPHLADDPGLPFVELR